MAQVVKALKPEDYEVSEKDHSVALTEIGVAHVEELLGEPLSDPERPEDILPEQARLLGFFWSKVCARSFSSIATRNISCRVARLSLWTNLPVA